MKLINTISKHLSRNFSKMNKHNFKPEVKFTEAELRSKLTPEQYNCTQEEGTERPGKGIYTKFYEQGQYDCVVCGVNLFGSEHKFDSGCGWPAFWGGRTENIVEFKDTTHGMTRVEVRCKNCAAHLGHIFEDGPQEKGGMRYCINSACMNFSKK